VVDRIRCEEVELALASMLTAPSVTPARRDVAKLEHGSGKLRVQLVDAEGVVIGERTLDGAAPCAELGRMAAIVIASWESDVHPEFVRQPAEIVRVDRAPPPEKLPASPPPAAAAYDVAAGVTVGQVDTLAAGASIGAAWFPRSTGLGGWVKGRIFFVVMVERKYGSSRSGDASQKLRLDGMRMKSRTEASPSVHKGFKPSRGVSFGRKPFSTRGSDAAPP